MTSSLPVVQHDGSILVADPATGDMFALTDAPAAVLARAAAVLDNVGGEARRVRGIVGDELLARMGREKHLDVGSHRAERTDRREWDEDKTWEALSALNELGLVTPAQIEEAMPERTVRRPDGRKLGALLTQLLGDVADDAAALAAVRALARARTTRTYVKVAAASVDGTATADAAGRAAA